MTKKELCRQISDDLLQEDLLNEADVYDIVMLRREVEDLLSRHLEEYTLVWKGGIVAE
ncbi:MAG: hypothetical protein IJ733_15870 [Lachnospiraceae bacterium]|nr:hypothetical protein [Lachnospiraceae bacterium]